MHRLSIWIKKQDPVLCYIQEAHFKYKDTNGLRVKGWEEIYHTNTIKKKAGVAMLISDSKFQSKEHYR